MLLFDSLHNASHAMGANQLGMQVVGQNLSNAENPGYIREQLVLQTGTSRRLGNGVVTGTGVSISGVRQVIDNFATRFDQRSLVLGHAAKILHRTRSPPQ